MENKTDVYENITIDDAISRFCKVFDTIDVFDSKQGISEMMTKAMVNAKTADERFKAGYLSRIMGIINDQIETLRYINKPVRQEGTLQTRSKDEVQLKNITISSGAQIEYLSDGEWKFGALRYDEKTGRHVIVNVENGKPVVENVDGIHARIR